MSMRSGVVTWQSGGYPNTYFNANWTSGSKISIAGSECTITRNGRPDAVDDRPRVLLDAAFAAADGSGIHGLQFRISGAEEDGEHRSDQPAVREIHDGEFTIHRFHRQRIGEVMQRHAYAEQRHRGIGIPLRDSQRLAAAVLGRSQDWRCYLPGAVLQVRSERSGRILGRVLRRRLHDGGNDADGARELLLRCHR